MKNFTKEELNYIGEEISIITLLQNNMMEYATYLILQRALPSVEDGLKPVYLRILWTMNEMNATKLLKSGNVEGEVFKYHPHGQVYQTMVNMTQKDRHHSPFLTGKGNFGQHTSKNLSAAASRYTEVKLSELSLDVLSGIKKNMVEYVKNFDGTKKMPKHMPVKFPLALCYASSGVGVGIASTIPSYNLNEVCDATILYLQKGEKTMLYPDFSTHGYIVNNEEAFKSIINTGRGSIKLRGKCAIEGRTIAITEIPYTTDRETIIDGVIKAVNENKLKEVSDVKDLTGLKGMKIEVYCKRDADMNLVIEKLYKLTRLEDTFSANMNFLVGDRPMLLGFYDVIDRWYKFRIECIKRALKHDIKKLKEELHLLYGLKKILLDVDEAIKIIRHTKKDKLNSELQSTFEIDKAQALYIRSIKLENINEDYIISKINEIKKMETELAKLIKVYKSEDKLKMIVIKGLNTTKDKLGVERKTLLIEPSKAITITKDTIVEDYNVKLLYTKEGYFKKIRLNAYKGENKLKDGDEVITEIDATNKDEVVFFADDLNAYKFRISELEDGKLNSLGTYIPNIINEKGVNKALGMTAITDNAKFVVLVYENRLAKVDINSYKTIQNRKKLTKSLFDNSVVSINTFHEDEAKIVIETHKGKQKEIALKDVGIIGKRDTQGIQIIKGKDLIKEVKTIG